ncbi:MAG: cobalamin-dependent protein [Candidatus Omnitrophota bacterium]
MTFLRWHEINTLRSAFGLLRRFMLPAVATYYLLHVEIFGAYDFKFHHVGVFSALTEVIFKVCLIGAWAFFFSVLADLTSRRELAMTFRSSVGAAAFLPLVFLAIGLPQLVHFLGYLLTGQEQITVAQWSFILFPLLSWFIAGQVLCGKGYIERIRVIDMTLLDLFIMSAAVFAGLCLDHVAHGFSKAGFLKSLLAFSSELIKLFVLYYSFVALAKPAQEDKGDGRELILINPLLVGHFFGIVYTFLRAYPIFFASLRAFTPATYKVFELNRVFWADEYARGSALVAISCYTSNAALAYSLARRFRAAGSKVVMGGPHVGLFPEEALEFCDAVVIGPAEGVWDKILADYEAGTLSGVYQGSCSEADLDRLHGFLMTMPPSVVAETLMVSRGCKFRCYFCTHTSILNTASRCHDDIIALLKRASGMVVAFSDSNIYMNHEYTKELLRRMIPLKITWNGCASIDIARDDEVVELLKQSGCAELMIGYEIATGSQEEERKGKFLMTKDYIALSRKLTRAGISIKAQFMFGFPTDNWSSLWHLWKFCFKLSPGVTGVSYMSPIPGSLYYDDVVRQDRMTNLNWTSCSGHKMICEHPRMGTPAILKNGFILIHTLFFLTTSRMGRVVFAFILGGLWCLFQR